MGAGSPFPAGTPISLGGVWHPTDTRDGQAIFNGVYYPQVYFGFGQSGGTFVTPSVAPTGLGQQIVSVPFTFNGFVTAFATSNPGPEDVPVFTATLFGGGAAAAAILGQPPQDGFPAVYGPVALPGADYELQYVFSPVAAPIPEPGTMVLMGSGVVGVLATRWRRRSAHVPGRDACP
jgi:hypothetical protein